MAVLKLFNSLSRKKEIFKPLRPNKATVYTCGPTVYDYVSIGNWRTYILGDLVVRALKYFGYKVRYIMNITDVGHLTGDNLGDSSIGEDRLEKGAKREGKSAWDIANFYTKDFWQGYKQLNLKRPFKFTKATDYIKEQISLVKKIIAKGFTYKISNDGIYFDVQAYEKAGYKYGVLSTLKDRRQGARVINKAKKDRRDFALWKFSPKNKKRQMEWPSPWGTGFPGWHIECSAMCLAELGEQLDIHIGGEDLRSTHHPNEIAQSEAATGKRPFVKYWLHGAFLLVDNGRMGKSLGNAYTLADVVKKGFDPLALRYFYLTGHYRKPLNFTWQALAGAQKALNRLRDKVDKENKINRKNKEEKYEKEFSRLLGNDLDMPGVLALVWQVLKDNSLSQSQKQNYLLKWDQILGLGLLTVNRKPTVSIPDDIKKLVKKREERRKQKKWLAADKIRKEIEDRGFTIEDLPKGTKIKAKAEKKAIAIAK